jgi:hypothetical protein
LVFLALPLLLFLPLPSAKFNWRFDHSYRLSLV